MNAKRWIIAVMAAAFTSTTHAATRNWDGDTSATWATAGNWDTAPANSLTTDIANFNLATYGGNPIWAPAVGTATSINGLTIGASNGGMTLTHTAALSIGNSGINIANGAGAFTISGSTTLGASQGWTNNSANLFTFGAVVNGANLLTIGGSGNTTASGVIGNGAGGLTKEEAGLLTLNAANSYTGATTVNGGELRWGIINAIAGGALNINNGGTVNIQTFNDTVGTVTLANGGSITGTSGTLTTSSGGFVSNDGGTISGFSALAGLKISGGLTYNSTGPGSTTLQIDRVYVNELATTEFNIANGDAPVDFEITQALVTGSGNNSSRTIRKTGAGVMQLSGSEANYTTQNYMPLEIWDGTVIFNKSAGVNAISTSSWITIGDGTGAAGSAILKFNADSQLTTGDIAINSDGLFDLNGKTQNTGRALTLNSTGQLQLNNGSLTVGSLNLNPSTGNTTSLSLGASGTLTLGGDVTLKAAGTGRAQITGSALSLGAANRIFNIGLGSGADYDLLAGAGITGARSLTKNGMGRLVLTGSNNYTLGTVVNVGTLQIGDGTTAGTMTSTGALTMGGGTFAVLAPTSGSSSQTVASLATTASTVSTIKLTPGTSGNTTLTISGGTLSTGAGSSMNFDYTAGTTVGGSVGNSYVVWSPTLTAGIIAGAYSVTDSGGTGFATRNGANVVRLTDSGGAGLPVITGSATGFYFVGSGYSTDSTTTPGSLIEALSGAVAASSVTVDTTGLTSGANLALGTNLLTLGAGMAFNGPNPYEITGSGTGGIRATSGSTLYLNNGNTSTVTISAPIVANGANSLVINGTGSTILSGVNTYTGATTISGGTLRLGNQIALQNSTLTMNGGTPALVFDSSVTGNAFTLGGLAASASGAGFDIALQNNAGSPAAVALTVGGNNASTTYAGVLSGSGSLIKTGAGALTLSGANTYSGGTTLNGGTLSVNSDAALGATGTGITVSGSTTLNSLATTSTEYNRAISLGAGTTLTLTHAGANTASFSGAITGSGNLAATLGTSGSTIALSNTGNTFTGDVLINTPGNGNLKLSFNSIGDAGKLSLGKNGYTLQMQYTGSSDLVLNTRRIDLNSSFSGVGDGMGYPINMFENNGTGTITFNAGMTVAASKTGTFFFGGTNTGDNTYAGVIPNSTGGTLSIAKYGAGKWILSSDNTFAGGVSVRSGTLVLSGTNSYTGQTDVQSGTLVIGSIANYGTDSAIGKGTSGVPILLGSLSTTGTLVYMGEAGESDRTIQINNSVDNRSGGATILNYGTGALTFDAPTFNVPYVNANSCTRALTLGGTYGGTISGKIVNNSAICLVGITKTGSGTWTLQGANTYTGTTAVNAGTLTLQSGAATITQALAGLANQVAEGTLMSNKSGDGNLSTTFTSYSRSGGATGNIVSTGGINGTDNTVNITGTAGFIDKGLYFGGAEFAARNAVNGYVRAMNYATTGGDANTVDIDTVLASRHVKLSTASYSGAGVTLLSLNLQGSGVNWTNTSGTLTTPGILKSGGGSSTISGGNVNAGSNVELVIRADTALDLITINSVLNLGNTSSILTKSGAGTLTLGGNNTYQGQTHVNAGTLSISANNNLGAESTGATLNLKGGTLQATGTFGLFNGTAGTNNRAVTLLDQSTIEVTGANTLTIAGVISGAGNLIKDGSGTLTLSGANTYTGETIINGGKLALGGHNVLNGKAITLNGGTLDAGTYINTLSTLKVSGSGAAIVMSPGAVLAFADSRAIQWGGTLNLSGVFAAGTSLRFGTTSAGLTSAQIASLKVTGYALSLDANGYLTGRPSGTLINFM